MIGWWKGNELRVFEFKVARHHRQGNQSASSLYTVHYYNITHITHKFRGDEPNNLTNDFLL